MNNRVDALRDLPKAVKLGKSFRLTEELSLVMTVSDSNGRRNSEGERTSAQFPAPQAAMSRSLKFQYLIASPPLLSQKLFLEV